MMANKLSNITTHNGRQFSWLKNLDGTHKGFAEASSLEGNDGIFYTKIWGDSFDRGFIIKSHRTGEVKLFLLDSVTEKPGENQGVSDVESWHFKTEDGKIEVVVFND